MLKKNSAISDKNYIHNQNYIHNHVTKHGCCLGEACGTLFSLGMTALMISRLNWQTWLWCGRRLWSRSIVCSSKDGWSDGILLRVCGSDGVDNWELDCIVMWEKCLKLECERIFCWCRRVVSLCRRAWVPLSCRCAGVRKCRRRSTGEVIEGIISISLLLLKYSMACKWRATTIGKPRLFVFFLAWMPLSLNPHRDRILWRAFLQDQHRSLLY